MRQNWAARTSVLMSRLAWGRESEVSFWSTLSQDRGEIGDVHKRAVKHRSR